MGFSSFWFLSRLLAAAGLSNITLGRTPFHNTPSHRTYTFKQTVDRVIVHIPAKDLNNSELVNQRFAYVAVSRARVDAQIYTNDASELASRFGKDVSKTAAVQAEDLRQAGSLAVQKAAESAQEIAQV